MIWGYPMSRNLHMLKCSKLIGPPRMDGVNWINLVAYSKVLKNLKVTHDSWVSWEPPLHLYQHDNWHLQISADQQGPKSLLKTMFVRQSPSLGTRGPLGIKPTEFDFKKCIPSPFQCPPFSSNNDANRAQPGRRLDIQMRVHQQSEAIDFWYSHDIPWNIM